MQQLNTTSSILVLGLLCFGCASPSANNGHPAKSTPVMAVLPQFTAADVPAVGTDEIAVPMPGKGSPDEGAELPGKGLAEHPMLYIGEGCNKMFLVNDGKVIWTYCTGPGWEYDDIWLLSNGNILFTRMQWAGEVTPQKKIVWRIDADKGREIHTIQPIGLDRCLLVENGSPAKCKIINKKTGKVEMEHDFSTADTGQSVHAQFRRARLTAQGTYLIPFLQKGRVAEYDKNWKEIWSYSIPSPWAAVRLKNGNTLITDERDELTREVNSKGETVWEFKLSELPPEIGFKGSQSCVRLDNGNTIFCSRANGEKTQLVEITPDKKVVWALRDWKDLGQATAIQVLDDPGIPENPGGLQR